MINPVSAAAPDAVTRALQSAAAATGTSFQYLLDTAKRESSLDPSARAPGTSAAGLFQFLDRTWLQMIKEEGERFGLGDLAARIERRGASYVVADPQVRAEILALRHDPAISAEMAGAFTVRNADFLAGQLGRRATDGELYAAHFLGAAGAVRLISLRDRDPAGEAARYFPAEAAANRAIFFDRTGAPRSVDQVYGVLTRSRAPGQSAPASPPAAMAAAVAARPLAAFAPSTRGPVVAPMGYAAEPLRGAAQAVTSMALPPATPAPRSRFAPPVAPAQQVQPETAAEALRPAGPRSRFAPAFG
ncbi:MAG: lytic transglycosylase domain-containing protein [Bauldia sp.]